MGALEGKVAIVTGGASGIGNATARLFASQGATIVLADISENAEKSAERIVSEGGVSLAHRADTSDERSVCEMVQFVKDKFGRLDIFVANAGVSGGFKSVLEQDAADWERILRVNLIGPFLAIKYAAPIMAEQGAGSIICMSSIAALRSGTGGPAYSASKAGVNNLVQVAAQQLSTSNVRVNAICPGLIETEMTRVIFDSARQAGKEDKLVRYIPLGRPGLPAEIANAALFLASEASSYVNGHALVVDGGYSTSHPISRQPYGRLAK
tara:strand:+ start:2212 stop:3012 length:801 start_codon:yes stop_codon:yes gene_type:complete